MPELRAAERARLALYFDDLRMNGVSLRTAGVQTPAEGPARVFVQAFFENDRGAVIEPWTLTLVRQRAAWSVTALDATGSPTRLYKIGIPAERVERARRVEVSHIDIRLSFDDAAVFYDNIPELETALVVVGRGRGVFTPSDANERHQREPLYKKDRLEDDIDSLYIRGSSDFFAANVRIDAADSHPVGWTTEGLARRQAEFDAGRKVDYRIEALDVQVYGDTAVATFERVGTVRDVDGRVRDSHLRISGVWVRVDGQWKLAHRHESPF